MIHPACSPCEPTRFALRRRTRRPQPSHLPNTSGGCGDHWNLLFLLANHHVRIERRLIPSDPSKPSWPGSRYERLYPDSTPVDTLSSTIVSSWQSTADVNDLLMCVLEVLGNYVHLARRFLSYERVHAVSASCAAVTRLLVGSGLADRDDLNTRGRFLHTDIAAGVGSSCVSSEMPPSPARP
jgi:hypothetical protein